MPQAEAKAKLEREKRREQVKHECVLLTGCAVCDWMSFRSPSAMQRQKHARGVWGASVNCTKCAVAIRTPLYAARMLT